VTHAELTRDDRRGFASDCPGELARLGDHADPIVTPGGPSERTVTVWGCADCHRFISESGGFVLNCYETPPKLRAMARDLADGLDAGRA
jgi:hypothetical protein